VQIRGTRIRFRDADASLRITDLIFRVRTISVGAANVIALAQARAAVAFQASAAVIIADALHAISDRVAKHTFLAVLVLGLNAALSGASSLAATGRFIADLTRFTGGLRELLSERTTHRLDAVKMNAITIKACRTIRSTSARNRVASVLAATERAKRIEPALAIFGALRAKAVPSAANSFAD
jgi:hypothetical protein